MTNDQICNVLNQILGFELAGSNMYLHFSYFVKGQDRVQLSQWFRTQASEGIMHGTLVGDKIVSLGGVPITQPGDGKYNPSNPNEIVYSVKYSDVNEMLKIAVHFEKTTFNKYKELIDCIGEGDDSNFTTTKLKMFLENIMIQEIEHIDEVEKMLDR
ncbi:MAG: ferritin-like domain-containing protein [Chlorobiota bacterium]|nr:ferritin-like domain-containing protein [Chlorobiota bacterium]QQS65431.1 MAG: ferritin-like domain-containing protein [Chlorobiota bacterium]